jgi:superfamily II DNA or RNA helicase
MTISLRDYQEASLGNVRSLFASGSKRVLCVLPCGAGKTVMFAYMADRHCRLSPTNRVLFLVHRIELVEQAEGTFDMMGIDRTRIHIAMVQTVTRHLDVEPTPTLIITDEAHHASAVTYARIYAKWPSVPVVGLTATPCRLDGKPLGDIFQSLSVGVSAQWLTDHGWLCPYDYYAPRINLPDGDWKPRGDDYDTQDAEERLDRAGIYGDVRKYLDPKRKTIVYCPTVAMSKRIASEFGDIARHFDADTPKDERRAIMDAFRSGSVRVLCNCDLIGEGVDVPDCDCVMLLRPTKSVALYIQQAMRCLRPGYTGKRAVIYDFVGNVWRHGMPTDERTWSLTKATKCRNPSGEKEVTCRQCHKCLLVYPGTSRICPYCGNDNGKTKAEIEIDEKAELEKVKEVQKDERKKAWNFQQLVELGRRRGYRNPVYWAQCVVRGRGK